MKIDAARLAKIQFTAGLPPLRGGALPAGRRMGWRRVAFGGPVVGVAGLGVVLAWAATAGSGDWLRGPLVGLIGLNLLYLALVGWPGVLGGIVRACGGGLRVGSGEGRGRTAVVMPIYNEDVEAVFAGLGGMVRAIGRAGLGVDVFVLSDTRDETVAAAEEAAFRALEAEAMGGPVVRYRRRLVNVRRKVGNIAEFCAAWGGAYEYMVVLDADSVMGPATIGRLIGLMDANPGVGIIQTMPYPVGRETPFARMQQFAARLYTPLLVEGLNWWQQGEGNYWGHNAIVRIAPFVRHCEMPVLPGREPWGGEILCHDVVEAGLMQAGGYACWVVPEVMESFEGIPANLVDHAARERRWCQGNLQHIALLGRRGFGGMGRFHLAYGVAHYLSAVLVVAFLGVGSADLWLGGGAMGRLRPGSGGAALGLVVLTGAALYGAKVVALGAALLDPGEALGFGGRGRLLVSAAVEQLGAFLLAPVTVLFYAQSVAELVRGRAVRWEAQARGDRSLGWGEAWRRLRGITWVGVAWLGLLAPLGAGWVAWGAPLLVGAVLAVPVAVLSSRAEMGRGWRRAGVLVTPEERRAPAILGAGAMEVGEAVEWPVARPVLAGAEGD